MNYIFAFIQIFLREHIRERISETWARYQFGADLRDVEESPLSQDARKEDSPAKNYLKGQSERSLNEEEEHTDAPLSRTINTDLRESNLTDDSDTPFHLDKNPNTHPFKSQVALEVELESATIEIDNMVHRLKESNAETVVLREKVGDLTKNLHEQQDFIFSLQPHRQQITGSEAALEFGSLCASVEEWVDTTLGDAIDERRMVHEEVSLGQPAKDFLRLITLPGQNAFGTPDTDIHNVKAAIMRFLVINVFEMDFYCIEKRTAGFITSLLKSRADLQPRRDVAAQRSWRSETLTAAANRPDFIPNRRCLSKELTSSLYDMLSMFLPHHDETKLTSSIQRSVIEPALLLAHELQLSVDMYTFNYPYFHREEPEFRPVIPRDYRNFECANLLCCGKLLKFPEAGEGEVGQGYITYVFDLMPALMFESVKGDAFSKPQILRKSRILVAARKEEKGSFVSPREGGKNVTLLGWLDDLLHPKRCGCGGVEGYIPELA